MKKILILILAGVLLPSLAFADLTYSRDPSGYYITSPVSFDVSMDSLNDIHTDCESLGADTWRIIIFLLPFGEFASEIVSELSHTFTLDLSEGEYGFVFAYCLKMRQFWEKEIWKVLGESQFLKLSLVMKMKKEF
ncbi:unnamed protein product [marine sediment metagenome]|uniref:Uncharacterized protein n=1 Tax=marine sediment metagenome TaxID=412755 RepID=X1NUS1_9ZZZZ